MGKTENSKTYHTSQLIETAIEQLKYSYTPYSGFKVGAALLAKNGTVYTGCNIENAAYTPTNCAERTAFFKAVSEGVRDFQAICIVGGKDGVGTGAEAAIDEVGVGKRAHHKKGQKTDQKQKGDEEFFGKFRIMHRTP